MKPAALVFLALLTSACGRPTPTTPTPDLPLQAGPQWLQATGFSWSSDPEFPVCTPFGVPRSGTAIVTVVDLAREGQQWVARSPSGSDGTLEVRLQGSSEGSAYWDVSGTIGGRAVDVPHISFIPARDLRIALSGADGVGLADLEGRLSSPPLAYPFAHGRISGLIRFSDSTGDESSCPAVTWSIQPQR